MPHHVRAEEEGVLPPRLHLARVRQVADCRLQREGLRVRAVDAYSSGHAAPGHDARDVVLLGARLTEHVVVQVGGDVLGVDDVSRWKVTTYFLLRTTYHLPPTSFYLGVDDAHESLS